MSNNKPTQTIFPSSNTTIKQLYNCNALVYDIKDCYIYLLESYNDSNGVYYQRTHYIDMPLVTSKYIACYALQSYSSVVAFACVKQSHEIEFYYLPRYMFSITTRKQVGKFEAMIKHRHNCFNYRHEYKYIIAFKLSPSKEHNTRYEIWKSW